MKIRLLGTGAADGIPGLFGNTRVAQHARTHGGKDLRMRAAAVIDDCMKIDLGPDSHAQIQRFQLDPRDWSALIFTHSDDDHFSPREIQYFLFPFVEETAMVFPIYANKEICNRLSVQYPAWPLELVETHSFEPFQHGDYKITPIHAFHKLTEDAQNLIFEKDGKTFLYATDTGIWKEDTWEFLQGRMLDGLVLECSEGVAPTDYPEHLDIHEFRYVLERLHKMEVVSDSTFVTTTHHSHNGEATHAELEALFEPMGVVPGFDGMEFFI